MKSEEMPFFYERFKHIRFLKTAIFKWPAALKKSLKFNFIQTGKKSKNQ